MKVCSLTLALVKRFLNPQARVPARSDTVRTMPLLALVPTSTKAMWIIRMTAMMPKIVDTARESRELWRGRGAVGARMAFGVGGWRVAAVQRRHDLGSIV